MVTAKRHKLFKFIFYYIFFAYVMGDIKYNPSSRADLGILRGGGRLFSSQGEIASYLRSKVCYNFLQN